MSDLIYDPIVQATIAGVVLLVIVLVRAGVISWQSALAALASTATIVAAALLGGRRRKAAPPAPYQPEPSKRSPAAVVAPVVRAVDVQIEEQRAEVSEVEADPDTEQRLDRLADLANRGSR